MTTAANTAGRHGRLIAGLLNEAAASRVPRATGNADSMSPRLPSAATPVPLRRIVSGARFRAHPSIDASKAKEVEKSPNHLLRPTYRPIGGSSPASILEIVKILAGDIMDIVVT
jgi:hypothetical protein